MESPSQPVLTNAFASKPEPTARITTDHRTITTDLPVPESLELLARAVTLFPQVNCYQPPVIWDRAEGYQVFDPYGNCWIDFTSTAVMTNTGHGHPKIRKAIQEHVSSNRLLAQFSFLSAIRIELAERLLALAPARCEKVYFWTVGSEAIESAFRLAREWGRRQDQQKHHILTFSGDFHGWTLGAHQVSGASAQKSWMPSSDRAIHHLPFPDGGEAKSDRQWQVEFESTVDRLQQSGIGPNQVAAVFIETLQGWGALPLPVAYVQHMREWADAHDVLLVFDEIQTGFGRTGKWFAHEHYGVEADLICLGKGVTSTLPLAAVLGPAEVLDVLAPADVTTTHAAHPLACAAALANLDVIEEENLLTQAERRGDVAQSELEKLQRRFPDHISRVTGKGLVRAVHVRDPMTKLPSRLLARDWTWSAVKHGVMLFQVNRPTIKICPPLIIPDTALIEGIQALGDALDAIR